MALRLSLEHPRLSTLSCDECRAFVYEIPSGIPQTFEGPNGKEKIKRTGPTPCNMCPKGSPDQEPNYVLSDKNYLTIQLHRRIKTGVYPLPADLRGDAIFADNCAIIEEVTESVQRQNSQRELSVSVANAVAGLIARR